MNDLNILAKKNKCDKRVSDEFGGAYGYVVQYYQYLNDHRLDFKNVLEVGVWDGRSLKMWQEYFPNAMIYGIDDFSGIHSPVDASKIDNNRIKVVIGDQTDKDLLDSSFEDIIFDTIIDDGSHRAWHTQQTFKILFPKLVSGGYYFVENLEVSPIREYREFDDVRSATIEWLESIINNDFFSYYMDKDDVAEIESIELVNDLAIIKKR